MQTELVGKQALVTGGSRGIGRATVLELAARGAQVDFCYRADHAAAAETIAAAAALHHTVRGHRVDVCDRTAVDRLVAEIGRHAGGIDILVNNAGIFPSTPVADMSDREWTHVLETNLFSVFYTCRAVIPGMRAAGAGAIINVASVAGQRGSARHAHYAAAKGGVLAFTRSLAREVAEHNIRVNAISPGRITTEILPVDDPEERARWRADTPIRRLGEPEEIARAIAFLAGPDATYIIGETLAVNGGLLMT